MLDFTTPPRHICILRLSAIGDICHTLPVVRTIQAHWPETKISWVIGKTEYELAKGIDNIQFVIFDKKKGLKAYLEVYSQLKNIHFDALLHMQMSLRASLVSLWIRAKYRVGFDRKRAKDGQWLFSNSKIPYIPQQHVMDSLFGFSEALGIKEHLYRWDIPVTEHDKSDANTLLGTVSNFVIISPCSSKAYRNWHAAGYASLVDYFHEKYHLDVVLTGGNSDIEKEFAGNIVRLAEHKPVDLIGKTGLKTLLCVIQRAKCMVSPDSGPAHMATAMGTPVIGLYATTNPDRARPYFSAEFTVNKYPEAVMKKFNTGVSSVAWGTRVRDSWAMNLISTDDVTKMIDLFFQQPAKE